MDFAAGFWEAYARFLKTPLVTEEPNPFTADLSRLAESDLPEAYRRLQELDLYAIDAVLKRQPDIEKYQSRFAKILHHEGRIILVGCGASGRIAAQIAYWARFNKKCDNAVVAVLAGGDITLIEAIESCEDNPEFAARQLAGLNLNARDCVIGLSASGESPFILAALRYAKDKTKARPLLICANPVAALLERDFNHPAGDEQFEVVSLTVGQMALTGSTRMQATTAMTLFLVLTLLQADFDIQAWRSFYAGLDFTGLCPLTVWEAEQYRAARKVTYYTSSDLALPVLADMTERSPTFNLPRLYHDSDGEDHALLGLSLVDTHDSMDAWKKLLGRLPEALEYPDFPKTGMAYLLGFDLSRTGKGARLLITLKKDRLSLKADTELAWQIDVAALNFFEIQFFLRLILVNHSTLVMGCLHFYEGNLMTSLKPANYKLIDRAVRYIQFLYHQQTGKQLDYKSAAATVLKLLPTLKPQESIVFRALEVIEQETG